MTPAEVIDLAGLATTAVWRRWQRPPWEPEDWEDLKQEACLALLTLAADPRYSSPGRGLLISTACNAVRGAWRWRIRGSNPVDAAAWEEVDPYTPAPDGNTSDAGLPPGLAAWLHKALTRRLRKAGPKERQAVARDVLVMDLLLRGYHNEGIAVELGMTLASVDQRRRVLKDVLAEEARRAGVTAEVIAEARRHACAFDDFRYGRKGRRAEGAA